MGRAPAFLASEAFRALAGRQDGVVSRSQLLAVPGATRHHVLARVRSGVWQQLGPHVLVLHGGPLSRAQQLWAGIAHGGPGSALFGLSALEAQGFGRLAADEVHVVIPHGHHREDLVHPQVTVRVHESLFLGPVDLQPLRDPPRTRRERSVVDAASSAASERTCRAILAAAVQQRFVRAGDLRLHAVPRPTLPRRALILETLLDVGGGAHSLPELDYLRGLRRAGLPEPARQRVLRRPDGTYYLDADFDAYRVTVEINGAQHLDLLAKEYDDLRRTRLATGGRLVVDLGSHTVRHDLGLAVLVTADALLARGWRPPAKARRTLARMAARRPGWTWTVRAA